MYCSLFRKHTVTFEAAKDEIVSAFQSCIRDFPAAEWNMSWHCTPFVVYGKMKGDNVHIFSNGTLYNPCIPIIHGKLFSSDEGGTVFTYRLIPNNFTILFCAVFLILSVVFGIQKGSISTTSVLVWIALFALFIAVAYIVSWLTSATICEQIVKIGTVKDVD